MSKAKYLDNLEIQFTIGNYGFLIYISQDINDNEVQLIQIFSFISDDLVYEEKITKDKDITRLISLMSYLNHFEEKNGIHFKEIREFENHPIFKILMKSHKLNPF